MSKNTASLAQAISLMSDVLSHEVEGDLNDTKDIVDNANILLKELESVRGKNKKIDLNDKKLQLSFFDIEESPQRL